MRLRRQIETFFMNVRARCLGGDCPAFFLKTMQVNQNLLIAQVVKFLNGNGCFVWRQENNGRIDEQGLVQHLLQLFDALSRVKYTNEQKAKIFTEAARKFYRAVPCSIKGVPDVIGFHVESARWIAVEVKVGNDQLRPEQIEFRDNLRAAGGDYWLCRSLESFKDGWMRKHRPQMMQA